MMRLALTSLRYRTARLVLSSLAIGLGVAFVTGTLVMGASMNQAYFTSFAAGARNVDAAVTPHGSGSYQPGTRPPRRYLPPCCPRSARPAGSSRPPGAW
jgi:putative ABC transport system permease protein